MLSLPPHLNLQSYHSKLLLSHLPVEASLESIRAELAAGSGIDMDDNFLKIVHLRQNLEKVSRGREEGREGGSKGEEGGRRGKSSLIPTLKDRSQGSH